VSLTYAEARPAPALAPYVEAALPFLGPRPEVDMRSLILLALCAVPAPPAASPGPEAQLAALSWMVGGWAGEEGGSFTEEHWLAPRGGTMLGVNRTVKGGRSAAFEFLRIEARADGLVYLASPGGKPATAFRAREVSAERVVFENKDHDFPQRVVYWRAEGALHARIEGVVAGTVSAREWRWTPTAACGR
jgi:hypothetical protein